MCVLVCIMSSIPLISLYFVFAIQTADGAIKLSANPGVIDLDLTSLTVRCDVNQTSQQNMSAILSIIVSRAANSSSPYTELASVVAFLGERVNVLSSEGLTANGSIQPTGHSFLELHWDHPSDLQAGHYLCTVQGPDAVGHNIDWMAETDVTMKLPEEEDIWDTVRQLEQDLKLANEKLANLTRVLTITSQTTQQCNTAGDRCLQPLFFSPGFRHNNSTIAISRNVYMNVGAAENLCKFYGGYLVEIDDAEKYTAVLAYLTNTSDVNYVYIGIYKDFLTGEFKLRQSGTTTPFLMWAQEQPVDNTGYECICRGHVAGR
ncbi:uncharacterized protein LOC131934497 [Physella acuta]|uniref:uncharacterized protein LOC131930477 n=1 Tax=Physella acuta TaxID=109671 RepID=UPI0027DE8248|nr:uncharacterized protein LOC131930477 [Physella acuta]XP_059146518.1 uncharacterized protein LOC131934497 [Physella acuta]